MSNLAAVNEMKRSRVELMRQLEDLVKLRAQRGTYITKDMNRQIFKLEKQIHKMTMEHREEIKKCYSGSKTQLT